MSESAMSFFFFTTAVLVYFGLLTFNLQKKKYKDRSNFLCTFATYIVLKFFIIYPRILDVISFMLILTKLLKKIVYLWLKVINSKLPYLSFTLWHLSIFCFVFGLFIMACLVHKCMYQLTWNFELFIFTLIYAPEKLWNYTKQQKTNMLTVQILSKNNSLKFGI